MYLKATQLSRTALGQCWVTGFVCLQIPQEHRAPSVSSCTTASFTMTGGHGSPSATVTQQEEMREVSWRWVICPSAPGSGSLCNWSGRLLTITDSCRPADLRSSSVIFCIKAATKPAQQVQPLNSETVAGAGGCPDKWVLGHTQLSTTAPHRTRGWSALTLGNPDQYRPPWYLCQRAMPPQKPFLSRL